MISLQHVSVRLAVMVVCIASVGCASRRETFTGHDAASVWTAMLAAAESPQYDHVDPHRRWTVRENSVWIDDEQSRIEIHRLLIRQLHRPAAKPIHQSREWRFQVVLEHEDPPTAVFTSRTFGVPAHAWPEADQFFDEVRSLLERPHALVAPQ